MNTRKLFLTSLLAAAAMSVPAFGADDLTITSNTTIQDGAEYAAVSVKSGATVTQDSGTATFARLMIHTATDGNSESYLLNGGVLNITGGTKATASALRENDAGLIIGHWGNNGGLSTMSVSSGATLNVTNGWTLLSWDTSSQFTIGGEANLYGISFSKGRNYTPTATLTLSDGGRLNLGAGGFANETVSRGTCNVNLEGGTLGALEDWSAAVAMNVTGAVEIDTTKRVASTSGTSSAATGDGAGATISLSGNIVVSEEGSLTVSGAGVLNLSGATLSLSSEIQNSGTVTVSEGTVFNLTQEGTTTLISGGRINGWDSLRNSSFTYNGAAITVGRQLTSSEAGIVIYNASATAKTLTWNGGDSAVWKAVTITETSPSKPWQDGSTAEAFYNGDSVTFGIANASVMVSGTVKPAALTVSENTTFKGTDATVKVANGSLTFSNDATLEIQNGVTLDFGTAATALDLSNVTGDGTVKYVFNAAGGGASGLVTSDGFTGTVDYVGNLNWSDNEKEGQVTIGNAAMTLRLTSRDGQTDGMWGRFDKTFANNVEFGSDYKIWLTSGSVAFAGRVDAAGKTLTTAGRSNLTFLGAANVGTLNVTGGTVAVTGTGALSATVSNLAAGSSLTLAGTDANNKSTIALSGSTSISGNLTIGNATVDASGSNDIFDWNVNQAQKITLNEGGTLALGSNRQSFNNYVSFELNGGTITGTGDQDGAVDLYGANTIAVKKDSEISATIRMRSNASGGSGNVTVDVDEGVTLLLSGAINRRDESNTTRKIVKSGSGAMTLTADNSYFAAGFDVSAGTLVAGSASALGTGTVTVSEGASLGIKVVSTVSASAVTFNENAKFLIDLTDATVAEGTALTIISSTAISFNGTETGSLTSGIIESYFDADASVLGSWSDYLRTWAYDGSKLTLTFTAIPEPSMFGLLAGLGALALAGTRRRRRKA